MIPAQHSIRRFIKFNLILLAGIGVASGVLASNQAHAEGIFCNGHKVGWCFDTRSRKRDHAIDVWKGLMARVPVANAELLAKSNEKTGIDTKIAVLVSSIPVTEQLRASQIETQEAIEKLANSTKEAAEQFRGLKDRVATVLPSFIHALHEFLQNRDSDIDSALDALNDRIEATRDQATKDELRFQRNQLAQLRLFPEKFASKQEALASLRKQLDNYAAVEPEEAIHPQTLALLREAKAMTDLKADASALALAVEKRMNLARASAAVELAAQKQKILETEASLKQMKSNLATAKEQSAEAGKQLAALSNEIHHGIPNGIKFWQEEEGRQDQNWHCCDDRPYCWLLPDWDAQNDAGYAFFDKAVNDDRNASNGCR